MTKGSRSHLGDAPATQLGEELRRAISTFVRAIRQSTETPRSARSETLDLLAREGPMNVALLAQRRSVTHQTMRLIVAQLETEGFVSRAADPGDGRSQLVSLLAAGHAKLDHDRTNRALHIQALIDRTLLPDEQDALRRSIALLDQLSAQPKR